MSALLDVEAMAVNYGRAPAVWDVSLRVAPGERVGLLGANGAGKSTTLGAIAGILKLTQGRVRFDGERSPAAALGAELALVPEGRRLFGHMSVTENLMMGGYHKRRRGQIKARMLDVFAWFPVLAEKRNQPASHLSGGQQQMLAIGRGLIGAPRLLMLDEPFVGVSPRAVQDIMTVLHAVSAAGTAVLLVEQNVHRALSFVDRAYVIESGRNVLAGSRDALLQNPDFSRAFLGLEP